MLPRKWFFYTDFLLLRALSKTQLIPIRIFLFQLMWTGFTCVWTCWILNIFLKTHHCPVSKISFKRKTAFHQRCSKPLRHCCIRTFFKKFCKYWEVKTKHLTYKEWLHSPCPRLLKCGIHHVVLRGSLVPVPAQVGTLSGTKWLTRHLRVQTQPSVCLHEDHHWVGV